MVGLLVRLHMKLVRIANPEHLGHDAIPFRHKTATNCTAIASSLEMGRKVAVLARRVNDQHMLVIDYDSVLARTGSRSGSLTGSHKAAGRLSSGSDIAAGRRTPCVTRPIDEERVPP